MSYGGIKVSKLPLKDLKSPVMTFIKDFHGSGVIGDGRDAHTDDAMWTPAGIFSVICDVTTKFYPFDRQSCVMSIYAADSASLEINLQPLDEGACKDRYQPNSEWILVRDFSVIPGLSVMTYYKNCRSTTCVSIV